MQAAFWAAGTPIGGNDTLVAGHALSADCILVSNNQKHLAHAPGLALENWIASEPCATSASCSCSKPEPQYPCIGPGDYRTHRRRRFAPKLRAGTCAESAANKGRFRFVVHARAVMNLAAYYVGIKAVHVVCVAVSVTLFATRGIWVLLLARQAPGADTVPLTQNGVPCMHDHPSRVSEDER